jgi:hypothetical protein
MVAPGLLQDQTGEHPRRKCRLQVLDDKRVRSPFGPDFCRRAVARKDGDVVAERKNFSSDALDQQIEIAPGQITATDAAGEKDVAADEQPFLAGEKTETARAMAGDFQNLKIGAEEISAWRFFDENVRLHGFDLELEAEVPKKIAISNHGRGEWVTTDEAAELVLNPGDILNVIDVSVCQQQKLRIHTERIHPCAGAFGRVEEDPSPGRRN